MAWFVGVSAMAFVIPLVFSSWLEWHHDVDYLVYFTFVAAVVGTYVRVSEINVREVITANWKLSIAVGIASAAFVTWSVLGRIQSTLHPSGAYFVFEIGWRGILYGFVDALLLSAFPGLIARELMQRNLAGTRRRISYGYSRRLSLSSSRRRTTLVQRPAERPRHFPAGDRQQHHLHTRDSVCQSCRVRAGARVDAPSGGDAFLREQRPSATTGVCRFRQVSAG